MASPLEWRIAFNARTSTIRSLLGVALCLFFAYIFGVTHLKTDPITSFSEWNSLRHLNLEPNQAAYSIPQVLASIEEFSSDHAPLYFILLRFWRELVGRDLFTYRFLSVLFGQLTIAFAYRLALISGDRTTAGYAVFITSFLAFFLYFTHEVRMYSLLPMLVACVMLAYWRVVSARDTATVWRWLALTLSAAALIYAHFIGIISIVALGLYHLLFVPKNRRWFGVCLAMIAAGILFLPWLPIAWKGFVTKGFPDGDNLELIPAVEAITSIYSNGFNLIVPAVIAVVILRFRRLQQTQKYLLFLTLATFALTIVANEFASVVVPWRARYTIILAIPWACSIAVGLRLLPKSKVFLVPFFALWIGLCFVYANSHDMAVYSNEAQSGSAEVPHYEDFVYELRGGPHLREPILSFHPFAKISQKIHNYYVLNLPEWKDLVHVYYDEQGDLKIQSWHKPGMTLTELASENLGYWVIYNPQKTDLNVMDMYRDWFFPRFRSCERYVETDDNIIEYYLSVAIPCDLYFDDRQLSIVYDHGTELANVLVERDMDLLRVTFWWARALNRDYAYSLQIFDADGSKVLPQFDTVIGDVGPDYQVLDVSSLTEGTYVLKLIVYDRLSLRSQPGTVVNGPQRFERALDLLEFSIDA